MSETLLVPHPKARELVARAAAVLRAMGATEVYVFGSATTEKWQLERCDIDLAVRGLPPEVHYAAAAEVVRVTEHEVDILDLDVPSRLAAFLHGEGDLQPVA